MIFVGGPRQVGKAAMCDFVGKSFAPYEYYNMDNSDDASVVLNKEWPHNFNLIIFDELHKTSYWKRWIKGVYDTRKNNQQYLVTGSARLDVYQKGGDSLLGRYNYWRLHPFTIDEDIPEIPYKRELYERLLSLGGFPEPLLSNDIFAAKVWRNERFNRVISDDIRDLYDVKKLSSIKLFVEALRKL